MVHILPATMNGLSKESAADSFQIKSVSMNRFQNKLGILSDDQVNEIAAAVALCIGYSP
jgi:mRNA interferase MazF